MMEELLLTVGGLWLLSRLRGGASPGAPPPPPPSPPSPPPGRGGLAPIVPAGVYARADVLVLPDRADTNLGPIAPEPMPALTPDEVAAENQARQVRIRETMHGRFGLPGSGNLRAAAMHHARGESSEGVPSPQLLWWWCGKLLRLLLDERPLGDPSGAGPGRCRRGTWLGWSLVPQVYTFLMSPVSRALDPAWAPPMTCPGRPMLVTDDDGRRRVITCDDPGWVFGPYGNLDLSPREQYRDALGWDARAGMNLNAVTPATAFAFLAIVEALDGGWDASGTIPVFGYRASCLSDGDSEHCCPQRVEPTDLRPALLPMTSPEYRPPR